MKQIFLITVILGCVNISLAQNSNLSVNQPSVRVNATFIKVYDEKSAYLAKEWAIGKVLFFNGKTEYMPINYNAYDQRLERMIKGQPYTIELPVKEFVLGDSSAAKGYLFRCGFEPADGQGVMSFYQVVYEGKQTTLLKFTKFKAREDRKFNEANITVSFDRQEAYYFADKGGKITRIKNNKKSVTEYFKKPEVNVFVESKNFKFKEWEDVIEVLNFTEGL